MPAVSEKLQKVLANRGLGSRRAMEQWIIDGRIKVNGEVATLGDRVEEKDIISVDGRALKVRGEQHRHLLYNKPQGEICSRDDPEGRPSVYRRLPRIKNQRWISVGRLDFNTSGLLLFTTDGGLANRLMHPSTGIDREYAVRVLGDVTPEVLQNLRDGVELEDGMARFSDVQKSPESDGANQWYYVVLVGGKNREVRRLWESQGLTVSRLKRVRFGSFFIPSAVKAGKFIELHQPEITDLYDMSKKDAVSQ
jgi:23S rRNA pseudouridine2605 synthase